MTTSRFLFVFAHPDDESFYSGGLLAELAFLGIPTHVASLTPGNHPERIQEFQAATALLGAEHSIGHFPDGQLRAHQTEAEQYVSRLLTRYRPSDVVTFGDEPHYNHHDHMAAEDIVKTIQKGYPARLWRRAYTAPQVRDLEALRQSRPVTARHRCLDQATLLAHLTPNLTVPVSREGRELQLRALACHASQNPESLIGYIERQPLTETYRIET